MVSVSPTHALAPTDVIDSDHPLVRDTATRVVNGGTGAEAAAAVFDFARDEVRYDMAPMLSSRHDWSASATLERGYGFCQQKAVVLAALLRAVGIPALFAAEDLLDYKIPPAYVEYLGGQVLPYHGFTVAFTDGEWLQLDASLDRALCERKDYRVVEFTPGRDCILPATDRAGRPHFEHLGQRGVWVDLPDEVVAAMLALDYLHTDSWRELGRRTGPVM
ncbi:MAG: transglutaminase-like domain-containing protein [Acidimicrobiales bacterium]